jgi:hypothetical protein
MNLSVRDGEIWDKSKARNKQLIKGPVTGSFFLSGTPYVQK